MSEHFSLMQRFVWDEAKARANLRKHRVSFQTAARVFADPHALTVQERIEGGEYRWQTLGRVGSNSRQKINTY